MGGVRRVVTTLAAVAVSVVLAACSSGSETVEADAELVPVEAGQATPAPASDVPAFEGPWSVELARAWIGSDALSQTIVADGAITELELQQVNDDFESCLNEQGYELMSIGADGGFGVRPPEGTPRTTMQMTVNRCDLAHGTYVRELYAQMRRNPLNEDETAIVAACLVDAGLAGPGYDGEQYARDAAAGTLPFDVGSEAAVSCFTDPLGVGG